MTCLIRAGTADASGHEANKHLMMLVPRPQATGVALCDLDDFFAMISVI